MPLTQFYLMPGDTPNRENVLRHGELITAIDIPLPPEGIRSTYIKVRDRASYEFALTSAAVALTMDGSVITGRPGRDGRRRDHPVARVRGRRGAARRPGHPRAPSGARPTA